MFNISNVRSCLLSSSLPFQWRYYLAENHRMWLSAYKRSFLFSASREEHVVP